VSTLGASSIIELRFTASRRDRAIDGANEAASLLTTSARPVVSGVPAGAFRLVSRANRLTSASSHPRLAIALPVAVVFGFVLGLILAMARAQADPRVETLRRLADLLGVPCSPIDDIERGDQNILRSWERLSTTQPGHPRILMLPVDPEALVAARGLRDGLEARGWDVDVSSEVADDASTGLLAGVDPSTMRILLARPATKTSAVTALDSALGIAGARPNWSILT
jgi:hypothetical protein